MSKKPGKRRWSLTLLYSTAFFLIQLAAVLITAALSFLLTKLGVLDNLGIPRNSGFAMLIVMLLISVLVGSVVAIGTVKIPLRPFNRLINNIDRLAAGDFTARMHYGKVMGDNPVFQELSESFNAMAEELENTQMLRSDFINNFSHEFKSVGINQVLHIIMIDMSISGSFVMIGYRGGVTAATSAIAAQTVISGAVPGAYTNVIESENDNTAGLINDYGAVIDD